MSAGRDEAQAFRALARTMFFSNEVIDAFLESSTPGQLKAATGMIAHEQDVRARRRRERLFRKARFPQVKSFSGYDFSQVSFPDGYTSDDLMSLEFVGKAQDFVFHGRTGRGKTHLAIAVGAACVERGMQVRFFTAAELVLLLLKARSEARLDALMADLSRADLLIIDEMGYVPLDVDGSRLLFQVMSDCYERRSMVITTNIEFSKWGAVFGDDKLAAAAIDRIVHHGRLVEFNGGSRRMDEALMLGKSEE